MVRIDGCSTNLYDPTYHMGKLIEADMVDESKWTVSASSAIGARGRWRTRITITWTPRKSVYLYLKAHSQKYYDTRGHKYSVLRFRSRGYGQFQLLYAYHGRLNEFNDTTHTITVQGTARTDILHYSIAMKNNSTCLTGQRISITVDCPYYDGVQRSMSPSESWRTAHLDQGSLRHFPYRRRWTMQCWISNYNNVYNILENQRAPLTVKSDMHVDYHRVRLFISNNI